MACGLTLEITLSELSVQSPSETLESVLLTVHLSFLNLVFSVNGCIINAELNTRFNNNIFNILKIFNNIIIYILFYIVLLYLLM